MKTNDSKPIRVSKVLEHEIKIFRDNNFPRASLPFASELYVQRNKQLEADLEYLRRQQPDNKQRRSLL